MLQRQLKSIHCCVTLAAQNDGHIFISYNWSSKSTVLKIRDRMKEAGFKIWIDDEDLRTFY